MIGCIASTASGVMLQIAAALATGNRFAIAAENLLPPLPAEVRAMLAPAGAPVAAFLFEGDEAALRALAERQAQQAPMIQPIYVAAGDYPLEGLVRERSVSTNTAAAGGNASLMSIG